MRVLFILNPVSGKGRSVKTIPYIEDFSKKNGLDYKILQTQYPGHGTILAREGVQDSYDTIVAVGGDGTLLEVANGLAGSSVPLGVVPSGSGNDFSKSLNISDNVENALALLVKGTPRTIDVGILNQKIFLNVASIGFDAEIVRDIERIRRWIHGKAAYYLSVFVKFLSYRNKMIRFKIDGKEHNTKILLIAIANGKYYGGGMKVNPDGNLCDGLLDIIVIHRVPKYKIPLFFNRFIRGEHLSLPYVETYKCTSIEIESDSNLIINADGEIISSTPAKFEVSRLAMNVYSE